MRKLKQKIALLTALVMGGSCFYDVSPSYILNAAEKKDRASYVSPEVKDSSVTFRYQATTTPSSVQVKGSFYNNWEPIDMTDENGDLLYEYTINNLSDGTYEYGFMVDDQWTLDPINEQRASNGNCLFTIGEISSIPEYESPIIEGNKVTLKYYNPSDSKVVICGTIPGTNWEPSDTSIPSMTKDEDTNIWSYTFEDLLPGAYQYKFVGDVSSWNIDSENEIKLGGNSGLVIEGLQGLSLNSETVPEVTNMLLPNLKYYDLSLSDSDYCKEVMPEYILSQEYAGVVLKDNNLEIPANYSGDIILNASYNGKTAKVTVEVGKLYEYTIHYYEEGAASSDRAIWMWYTNIAGDNINGAEFVFNGNDSIDDLGRKWFTATYKLPTEAVNIIVKSSGSWDFKDVQRENIAINTEEGIEMWLVAGNEKIYTEEPQNLEDETRYLVLEFYKAEQDYDEWEVYSWTTISSNQHFEFIDKGDTAIVYIPVGKGVERCSFVIPKLSSLGQGDWIKDITADRYVDMPLNQRIVKAMVTYGETDIEVLPYNTGYETNPEAGTLTFYYRDDVLFKEGTLESLKKVQVEINGDLYNMIYDKENERYTYVVENVQEGEYSYCYHVTDSEGNTESYLDAFNTQQKDGKSIAVFKRLKMSVSGSINPTKIDYDENAVLTVETVYDQTEKDAIKACYVDLTSLGGPSRVDVDPELMEVTIAVNHTVTAGKKQIPIVVLDKYGEEHEGTATVSIKTRCVAENDFDWDEAIIYFMETDRFNDGDAGNNEPFAEVDDYDVNDPGKYHGGDFKGVTQKLDYLKELGINTIWISPIVENVHQNVYGDTDGETSYYGYHGYWALNFEKLNPHLGTLEDLHELIDEAHARGMKIMLDVVLNHAGYGTKEGETSTKAGFPTLEDQSVFNGMFRTKSIDSSDILSEQAGMPDFLTEDPEVRAQIINWQTAWVDSLAKTSKGNTIDYFRIDTVKHVDKTTWAQLKNTLTEIKPDFKMMGEYWGASADNDFGYLNSGTMDGLIDFGFKDIAKQFVLGNMESAEAALEDRNDKITNAATLCHYLSSHDVDGFLDTLDYNEAQYMLAVTLQLTAKGQPIIYYGEELGQTGKNDYPVQTNRYDFDWDIANEQNPILVHYKKLLAARNQYTDVFTKGTRQYVGGSDQEGYLLVSRIYEDEEVVVGFNNESEPQEIELTLENTSQVIDIYSGITYKVGSNHKVTISIPSIDEGGTVILSFVEHQVRPVTPSTSDNDDDDDDDNTTTTPTSSSNKEKEDSNVITTVSGKPMNKEALKDIQKQLDKEGKMSMIGSVNETIQITVKEGEKTSFDEPIDITIDLSDATFKDARKLTLVRYEIQKDGTYKVTKLGGHYDLETGTFKAKVSEVGSYGIVEADELTIIEFTIGNNLSILNGEVKANDVSPQIIENRTMVPLRYIAENLGVDIKWDNTTKTIEMSLEDQVLTMRIGEEIEGYDAKPILYENRTLVPLRYIAEELGAHVLWIPSEKAIEIVK